MGPIEGTILYDLCDAFNMAVLVLTVQSVGQRPAFFRQVVPYIICGTDVWKVIWIF